MNLPEPVPAERGEMTLFEHLGELRKRLLISSMAIAIAAVVCFSYTKEIFHFVSLPFFSSFKGSILIGTGPAEAFILRIKLALFSGAIVAMPVLCQQLWLFIAPGLYPNERRLFVPFVFSTTALFLLGAGFCYSIVLPFTFEFFSSQYSELSLSPTIRVSEHLSMMLHALLGFGIVFEMPVVAYLLGRSGVITHRTLIEGSRYAVVIIFIVSAVLTPPDVLTQLLMAAPLLLLYGLSILIVKAAERKDKGTAL
jgi:sec-independent protein translocase protein TatC